MRDLQQAFERYDERGEPLIEIIRMEGIVDMLASATNAVRYIDLIKIR